MKNIIMLIAFPILLFAQDTWIRDYQPFGDGDYWVEDVLVCSDGGYAVNGFYWCWDPEPTNPCNDYWGYLMKTDSDGNMEWVKMDTVSWINEGESLAFVQTSDGGFVSSVASMWGGTALIKRDSLGNREWVNDNGGWENGLYVHSMDNTMDGNIVLGGRKNGNATIRKITDTGEELWTQSYLPQSASIQSVIQTSDGGYAGTGYINFPGSTGMDILIIKTNANGDSSWMETIDGNNHIDKGMCIAESFDHAICVSGITNNLSLSFFGKYSFDGDTLLFRLDAPRLFRSFTNTIDSCLIVVGSEIILKSTTLGDIIWETDFIPYGAAQGDKRIRELSNGGFIYNGRGHWGDSIVLVKTDLNGQLSTTNESIPSDYHLTAYPNPFNPTTNIILEIPISGHTQVTIYNLIGQKVKTLVDEYRTQGQYQIQWDGTDMDNNSMSSGLYFVGMNINDQSFISEKITLIK